jgi:hypothetical protein
MKLSTLVAFRNSLNKLSSIKIQRESDLNLRTIIHTVDDQSLHFSNFTQNLISAQADINSSYEKFENRLNQLKKEIAQLIEIAEKPWFQESYRLYEEEMVHETVEYILNRRPALTHESEMILKSRLMHYTDWQCPGMIIRPGLENFIQQMVSYDPLYLIDQDRELLSPSMSQFPELYQQRLRPYTINEHDTQPILYKIPEGQFGVCLVYNFFNFRPLEVIKQYLEEIYTKLKPGGTLIMTINDCDNEKAVDLVERHFACYTPGYLIKDLAQNIGYELTFSWDDGGPMAWLELRRPGQITSLKGGQTLAKRVAKSQ